MKIIEAVKNYKGKPFEIPDASRDELPEFFKEMGYKIGAEIGVYKGYFTKRFAKTGLKIYGIDLWQPYPDFDRVDDNRKARQDELYIRATTFLSRYKEVNLIRKTSMEAVKDFKDESLDFVYIDANHKLKYAVEDIFEWSKKIRKGGCISGHDYVRPSDFGDRLENWYKRNIHVKYAVDAYTVAHQIDNWYVIGRDKKETPEEKRDRCRSFMWIKK